VIQEDAIEVQEDVHLRVVGVGVCA
jgi:hypothetical protein